MMMIRLLLATGLLHLVWCNAVPRKRLFLSSYVPRDQDAESHDLWIKKYTQLFFTPSYPTTKQGLGNQLRVQHKETSLLYEKSELLYDKMSAEKYDFLNNSFDEQNPLHDIFKTETRVLKGNKPLKVSTMLQHLLLRRVFSLPRDQETSPHYHQAGTYLFSKFGRLGLLVQMQRFDYSFHMGDTSQTGVNILGILPGVRWGTSRDQVLVVSAHWDTVEGSPGVNDNGSGVVALVEIVRIIMENKDMVNTNSIIFAAFDKEESGCQGSRAFVRDFIVPELVEKYNVSIQGVYNLDTILGFSRSPDSQNIPEIWRTIDKEFVRKVEKNDRKGDFIMTVGRNTEGDTKLAKIFAKHLKGYSCHHLKIRDFTDTMPDRELLEEYVDIWRSDHVRFWYHNQYAVNDSMEIENQYSFNGLLISDTASSRGYMRECYHQACDTIDNAEITEENMEFLAAVTQAVADAVMELASESGLTHENDEGKDDNLLSDEDMLELIKTTIKTKKKQIIPRKNNIEDTNHKKKESYIEKLVKTENVSPMDAFTGKISDLNKKINEKIKSDPFTSFLKTKDYANISDDVSIIKSVLKNTRNPVRDSKSDMIHTNYENVESQVNIGTLHLTINSDTPSPPDSDPLGKYYLLNMPLDRLYQVKNIIRKYYQEHSHSTHENSPMVLKLKSDL